MFLITNSDGQIVFVPAELSAALGWRAESLLGQTLSAVIEFPADVQCDSAEVRARTSPCSVRQSDGSLLARTCELTPLPQGGCVVAIHEEEPERKQIEERLRLQDSALQAAANGIAILDRQACLLWVNRAFCQLTGYAAEEVVGLPARILKSGRHSREFYAQMWDTVLQGHVWQGEVVNQRKDGSHYDEQMTITPLCNGNGQVTHFIAIKQDITARKRLEAQYLHAQRMQSVGLLASGIAHDLNNVLAPIVMSIDLLRPALATEEARQTLDTIAESARRGASIVRQVLTFARGTHGERVPVQPRQLVFEIGRIVSETFPRNINLKSDVNSATWDVVGDANQLHQVLLNLCLNSRDAMLLGGELNLSLRDVTLNEPLAGTQPESTAGRYVVFRVADTGAGMAPEILNHLFEPFFTTKPQGAGTGLGLSTVLGIVRSHGGFLRVESEPNRGSTFEVFLPAATPISRVTAPEVPRRVSLPRGHGETILLVDDEEAIRNVTRSILTRQGYQVVTASNGTEACVEFARHRSQIAAVITDLMMPGMDGPSLIRHLRQEAPTLKVIATSGLSEGARNGELVRTLKELGVQRVLAKPHPPQTLLTALQELLEGNGQPEPLK